MEKENRLTWIEDTERRSSAGHIYALYRCSCGNTKEIMRYNAEKGGTKSCGCLRRERTSLRFTQHGFSRQPWFNSYTSMLRRCYDEKHISFSYYGGRGITVCQEWLDDPSTFLRDLGDRPSLNHSLDRIKNKNGYSKGNCRWATTVQQANNKRSNRTLSAYGVTQNITQWAEMFEIPRTRIDKRTRTGWSEHDALFLPKGSRKHSNT